MLSISQPGKETKRLPALSHGSIYRRKDQTAAIKAMKLTRKSKEFGSADAEERREAAAAARVQRIIKTWQCRQRTKVSFTTGVLHMHSQLR